MKEIELTGIPLTITHWRVRAKIAVCSLINRLLDLFRVSIFEFRICVHLPRPEEQIDQSEHGGEGP